VVSLTLTPMMCAKLLRHEPENEADLVLSQIGKDLQRCDRVLRGDAASCLALRTITLLVTIGTLVGTILLYIYVPKDFPGAGHRCAPRCFRSPTEYFFRRHDGAATALADVILQIRRWRACLRSSALTARTPHAQQRPHPDHLKPLEERKLSASE